jgi:hypothetical protein
MSYSLIDETGQARDIATNSGLSRLRAVATGALAELLDAGEGDDTLRARAAADAPDSGEWAHVREALSELSGRVVLSNGMEEE